MIGKVFDRIQAIRPVATKTERKLIDRICEIDKKDLIYLSITDLADMLGVAEATILRFCRKLEFKGFQDFKLHLSQDMVTENEEVQGIPQSIAEQMTRSHQRNLRADRLSAMFEDSGYDHRVEKGLRFCGGQFHDRRARSEKQAAQSGHQSGKFLRRAQPGHHTANLSQQDLLILVSVSGSTKDIIHLAEIAKENGTPIVVITNYSKSPLAKFADYLLLSCRKEAAYEGGSLATVVAQSYIIDVLCTAVFERLGNESKRKSIKASTAVSDKSI